MSASARPALPAPDSRSSRGVSPYRVANELTHEALMAALGRNNRGVSLGITEERGPGGTVVPLLRADGFAVGDEFATPQEAFEALLRVHALFNEYRRSIPVEAPVSPPEPPQPDSESGVKAEAGGRSRARVKAVAA